MSVRWKTLLKKLGPGIVTGASDDDPSGIATYSQAGAGFGFGALWVTLFTTPLMISMQEMCARIALVTGRGLVPNLLRRHSKGYVLFLVSLLVIANTINIGADLGMIADAVRLLIPLPFVVVLLGATVITLALQIFTSYSLYAKYLKWLTLSLFAYILTAFFVRIDWSEALRQTVFPTIHWTPGFLMLFVALLGTTISPYLYFWQASEELEEGVADGYPLEIDGDKRRPVKRRDMRLMRADVGLGMALSNLVAWFIIVTTAATLFANGGMAIETAAQAAQVLEPLAGKLASTLFALGIVGTGLLTVPILSGTAAYAVSELFHLEEGLSKKVSQARGFYGVIALSTVAGLLMNFLGITSVRGLIYAAVVNAVIAPPLIWAIIRIGNDVRVMGRHTNGSWSKIFSWLTFAVMVAAPLFWLWTSAR